MTLPEAAIIARNVRDGHADMYTTAELRRAHKTFVRWGDGPDDEHDRHTLDHALFARGGDW